MVTFRACLFADLIRTEKNGKKLIVGLYTGDLGVPQFPWMGEITPMLLIDVTEERVRIFVKVESASGKLFSHFEIELEGDPGEMGSAYVPLPPSRIAVDGPDEIIVSGSTEEDGEYQPIGSLTVILGSPDSDED
jgi:hypothetical protein